MNKELKAEWLKFCTKTEYDKLPEDVKNTHPDAIAAKVYRQRGYTAYWERVFYWPRVEIGVQPKWTK